MADIELKSFPFDSMEVLNEESGQMEADREYEAQIYRDYFRKFLSNGVYYGHYKDYGENSMKVILDVGLNIKVLKGAGIIEGADYENEEEQIIVLERPSTGTRIDRIVVQMNASLDTRKCKIIVKQGNGGIPAELTRTENIYEICLAEVTIKSTTNLAEEDIKDTRLDKNLCGIVNSLISIDGEEIYQNFKDYIASIIDNLVLKDQDNTINGNLVAKSVKDTNNKSLSTNDFTNAYKTKLDGIATGAQVNSITGVKGNSESSYRTGDVNITAGNIGLGNVENKSSATIRGELTKANVTTALGYTPPTTNTTYGVATTSANGLMSASDKSKLNGIASGANKTTVSNSLTDTSTTNALSAAKGAQLWSTISMFADGLEEEINKTTGFLENGGNIGGDLNVVGNFKNGYTYNNTTSEASNIYVSSSYNFRRSTSSSKRYKEDITENIEDRLNPQKLYDVPVVQFKYKESHLSKEDRRFGENILGFIVEDLQEKFESAVDYNENGTPEMWNYKIIIPAMLKLIQEQNERIKALENKEG